MCPLILQKRKKSPSLLSVGIVGLLLCIPVAQASKEARDLTEQYLSQIWEWNRSEHFTLSLPRDESRRIAKINHPSAYDFIITFPEEGNPDHLHIEIKSSDTDVAVKARFKAEPSSIFGNVRFRGFKNGIEFEVRVSLTGRIEVFVWTDSSEPLHPRNILDYDRAPYRASLQVIATTEEPSSRCGAFLSHKKDVVLQYDNGF